jgi:hypothetical protein
MNINQLTKYQGKRKRDDDLESLSSLPGLGKRTKIDDLDKSTSSFEIEGESDQDASTILPKIAINSPESRGEGNNNISTNSGTVSNTNTKSAIEGSSVSDVVLADNSNTVTLDSTSTVHTDSVVTVSNSSGPITVDRGTNTESLIDSNYPPTVSRGTNTVSLIDSNYPPRGINTFNVDSSNNIITVSSGSNSISINNSNNTFTVSNGSNIVTVNSNNITISSNINTVSLETNTAPVETSNTLSVGTNTAPVEASNTISVGTNTATVEASNIVQEETSNTVTAEASNTVGGNPSTVESQTRLLTMNGETELPSNILPRQFNYPTPESYSDLIDQYFDLLNRYGEHPSFVNEVYCLRACVSNFIAWLEDRTDLDLPIIDYYYNELQAGDEIIREHGYDRIIDDMMDEPTLLYNVPDQVSSPDSAFGGHADDAAEMLLDTVNVPAEYINWVADSHWDFLNYLAIYAVNVAFAF